MQFKTLFSAALAATLASAQSNMTMANLTSVISGNSNLSALGGFLQQFPMVESAMANRTNVTLFLPSNTALESLIGMINSTGMNVTSSYVSALLDYHSVRGVFHMANISSTPGFPQTYLNSTNYTSLYGGQVLECRLVNNSTVRVTGGLRMSANVTSSMNFTNGVVNVIDSVLTIPGNLTTTATDANLTAFLGAIQAANLSSNLSMLSDVTIFAPSNSAFQQVASAAGNLTAAQIATILEYHIINGTAAYSSGLTNGTVRTLAGKNLTVTIEDNAVFINAARVITPDILLANGVMHVIDSVLNPNGTSNSSMVNATGSPATGFSGATSQSTVPYTSGVPTPTTTITDLVTTISYVASGYTVTASSIGANPAATSHMSSSSKAAAAHATGAVGAAALFGGAAFLANM